MLCSKIPQFSADYAKWWERFCNIYRHGRLPHAFLLVSPSTMTSLDFVYTMAAALLCNRETKPCSECQSCRLVSAKMHPDLNVIKPDKAGGIIKIDQIRELQDLAYHSPQLGGRRVILLQPAEKMNVPAANALLKLLEEPPASLTFILLAEHISTILPTILSRCQQWHLPLAQDWTALSAEGAADKSEREKLLAEREEIIQELISLVKGNISVCALASKWAIHGFSDLIWVLSLINAQMLKYLLAGSKEEHSEAQLLQELANCFTPPILFRQMDELYWIVEKLNKNLNINPLLTLENLLLGYKSFPS
nr:hypothetical protein [Legionella jordanis]